jgi:hypothetical protein
MYWKFACCYKLIKFVLAREHATDCSFLCDMIIIKFIIWYAVHIGYKIPVGPCNLRRKFTLSS